MTSLLDWLEKGVLFLLVLGPVVLFHELGHFVAAKFLGVKVEVYAFGFGRRLFGWRIGETDYRVSLIPLGGYVRMAGEMGEETDTQAPDAPPRERSPRDFEAKSTPARLAIMLMGPVFNGVLAVGLLAACYVVGLEMPAWLQEAPRVGTVAPLSPAAGAGFAPGDLVLSAGGVPTPTWETLDERVLLRPGTLVEFEVERAGERLALSARPVQNGPNGAGWLGIDPCARLYVRGLVHAMPAAQAGMQLGDEILSVSGTPPCSPQGLIAAIKAAKGAPLAFEVRRGDVVSTISIAAHEGPPGTWRIGVTPGEETVVRRHPPGEALRLSLATNWRQSGEVLDSLASLVTARLSIRAMSGPLEIADIAQRSADQGFVKVLELMSIISLNLGVINLLPIPILDGGRIFILLVEGVRGRELQRRTKEWILQIGLVMIVLLMAVVLLFDVIKQLER